MRLRRCPKPPEPAPNRTPPVLHTRIGLRAEASARACSPRRKGASGPGQARTRIVARGASPRRVDGECRVLAGDAAVRQLSQRTCVMFLDGRLGPTGAQSRCRRYRDDGKRSAAAIHASSDVVSNDAEARPRAKPLRLSIHARLATSSASSARGWRGGLCDAARLFRFVSRPRKSPDAGAENIPGGSTRAAAPAGLGERPAQCRRPRHRPRRSKSCSSRCSASASAVPSSRREAPAARRRATATANDDTGHQRFDAAPTTAALRLALNSGEVASHRRALVQKAGRRARRIIFAPAEVGG